MAGLEGRVVLITGGAGTIGYASAVQFAEAGAAVVISGRNRSPIEDAAKRLRDADRAARVVAIAADVSDYDQCADLVRQVESAFGRLDFLVHCALSPIAGTAGRFEQTDPATYPELMRQAICAPLYLIRAALPAMRRAGGGSIVAFPSDAGKVAAPNQTMVGTTRAAVMMFMRSLALEVSGDAIRCNCIAPTFVDTAELRAASVAGPHGSRIAKAMSRARLGLPVPDELAELALFLCSAASAHLTGQIISVNGGLHAV